MTAHLRRLLFSAAVALAALVPTQAHAQRRSVMEGMWASSTTVLVSTPTQKVTVGNGGLCFADATCQTTAAAGSSGLIKQYASTITIAAFTLAGSAVPNDDSKPQISEGWQILVATFTPLSASSTISVRGSINMIELDDTCDYGVMCLYTGTTANPLACFAVQASGGPTIGSMTSFVYNEMSGSTSARNYSLRGGGDVVSCFGINYGSGGVRKYGGALTTTMEILEIGP